MGSLPDYAGGEPQCVGGLAVRTSGMWLSMRGIHNASGWSAPNPTRVHDLQVGGMSRE